ncbi:MAG: hypothetical protein ACK504_01830 [Bacteroidota bacterium]
MDFTASDGSDTEETVLKLTRSNSTRPEFQLYNDAIVANDGKVGIGLQYPPVQLSVFNTETQTTLGSNKNSAIRIMNQYVNTFGTRSEIQFALNQNIDGSLAVIAAEYTDWNVGVGGSLLFATKATSSNVMNERMRINAIGNVLIGKTTQVNTNYKLDVNGSVRANEIVVNTTGADFVFEENYKLKTLDEVETYIKANKHLPEIASACEMEENGLGLAKMNTQLLQKVEELTLYLIELKKTIDAVKVENKKLNDAIAELK